MKELQKSVMGEFDGMIQDIVEELREAEKNGEGLDMTALFGKQSHHYMKLVQHFDDCEARKPISKKKGWGK